MSRKRKFPRNYWVGLRIGTGLQNGEGYNVNLDGWEVPLTDRAAIGLAEVEITKPGGKAPHYCRQHGTHAYVRRKRPPSILQSKIRHYRWSESRGDWIKHQKFIKEEATNESM